MDELLLKRFNGRKKLQSAIEMLSVYSWAIILIAMVVSLVFVLNGPFAPAQYLSPSCNIQPLMLCIHTYLAPYTKSGNPIKFTLIFVNNLGATIKFTDNPLNVTMTNVGVKGTGNFSGSCAPTTVSDGGEAICTVSIYGNVEPPKYSSVSSSFGLNYYICKSSTCSGPYTSTGTSIEEISPGSEQLMNLSIYTNPAKGYVIINGIRYKNGIYTLLEPGNYTIYALPPSGYTFNHWILGTVNSSLTSENSIATKLTLTSNSSITANFTKVS